MEEREPLEDVLGDTVLVVDCIKGNASKKRASFIILPALSSRCQLYTVILCGVVR